MKHNKHLKKLVFASLYLSSFLAIAESPWKTVPLNTTMGLKSISFIGQFGWIVERVDSEEKNNPGIFITTDGGETWAKNTTLPSQNLRLVEFVNDQTGWALGEYLWKTIDGGASWVKLKTNLPSTDIFSDIDFINEQQGWLVKVGELKDGDLVGASVYSTTNGGQYWNETPLPDGFFSADIQFYDADSGWVIPWGHDGFFHSINGGKTWYSVSTDNIHYLVDINLFSDQEGWALGYEYNGCTSKLPYKTHVYYSSDAGKTITDINQFCSLANPSEIDFADAEHGWLANGNRILSTNDKGLSWIEEYQLLDKGDVVKSLHMTSINSGWAVSWKGLLLKYSRFASCAEENIATFFKSDDFAFRFHVPSLKDEHPSGLGVVQADFVLYGYAPDGKSEWMLTSHSKKQNPCIDENLGTLFSSLDFKLPKIKDGVFNNAPFAINTSFVFSRVDEAKTMIWTQQDSEVQ